jgi:hypothetical protein
LASLNNIFKYKAVVLAFVILQYGCKKSEIYPIVPSLEFKSYYFTQDEKVRTDTLLGIIFTYRDGDGDIGLNTEDTLAPFNSILGENNTELNIYYNNLHIDYLTWQNGKFEPVIMENRTDTLRYFARLQNITPLGKHKAIRGDINWKIFLPQYVGISRTIKLRIKIYDRALHQSNIIESPVIELP